MEGAWDHPGKRFWFNCIIFQRWEGICSKAPSWGLPGSSAVKNPPTVQETGVRSLSGRSLGEGNGNPLQCLCLGNPMDRGAWWATVRGVAKSWPQLGDYLEKEMATHSSPFAWKIPWTQESGRLQTMGMRLSDFPCFPLRTKQQRLPT